MGSLSGPPIMPLSAQTAAAPTDAPDQDRLIAEERGDLAAIRALAMRLIGDLDRIAHGEPGAVDDRLLGRSKSLIDGFSTLAQIVGRVIEHERQSFAPAGAPDSEPPLDEQELDRRITDELDRIAVRQRAAGSTGADISNP